MLDLKQKENVFMFNTSIYTNMLDKNKCSA